MKSALRRRARKVVRSAPLEIPLEDPFFEVDPSAPTTKDAKTDIPKGYRANRHYLGCQWAPLSFLA